LLPTFHEFYDFVSLDRDPLLEAIPQCVIDEIQAFMLGGMQNFQILLDRGFLLVASRELIVGHAEAFEDMPGCFGKADPDFRDGIFVQAFSSAKRGVKSCKSCVHALQR